MKPEPRVRAAGPHLNDQADSLAFGRLLRRYRLQGGLSQEALAERAGLSADAVGMLERGVRRMPYEHTLESLASALGLGKEDRVTLFSVTRRRRVSPPRRNFPTRAPLPVPLTRLIGRTRDLAVVRSWFVGGGPRLITITGTGGVGKTRFALQLARDLCHSFNDEVVFVSLAAQRDPASIAPAILACLDRKDRGTPASLATLCGYVANRRVLFVMDNLEQIVSGFAVICEFLERCPEAIILATSRERLHVRGEHEYILEPLDIRSAVELFIERGCALQPHLQINSNDEAVLKICSSLDGLPLAIELAAARLRREPLRTLLEEVSSPLSALTFGGRDAPARQHTMRAAIDWSYDLLTEQESTVFCICALFAGGGSLDAINAIVMGTEPLAGEANDAMMALADKHLLRLFRLDRRETRFEMLEVIREYARERFDSLQRSKIYARAFAVYYVEVTERHKQSQAIAGSLSLIDLVAREYANVCAALRWLAENDRSLGLRLALLLPGFWERKGMYSEALTWLEALVDPLDETVRREDPMLAWRAINALALSYYWTADAEQACALNEQGLAMARCMGDPGLTAKSLNNLGIALIEVGEADRAREALEDSLAIKEGREDAWSIASTVGNLGIALRICREYEAALSCHQRARDLFRSIGDTWGEIGELNFIGDVYCDCREYGKAASCYAKSLEANSEGIRTSVAHSLEGLVTVAARRLEFRRVAVIAGAINRIRSEAGQPESPSTAARFEKACAAARTSLGEPSFVHAFNDGAEMSLVDSIEVGRKIGADLSVSP